MILKKEVIEKLSSKLKIEFSGVEQDWAVEFADPERLNEFILFYQETELDQEEKIALMALILSSYNDFLNLQKEPQAHFEGQIKSMINNDSTNFGELINYWSLEDENNKEMLFKITPFARQIKASN